MNSRNHGESDDRREWSDLLEMRDLDVCSGGERLLISNARVLMLLVRDRRV